MTLSTLNGLNVQICNHHSGICVDDSDVSRDSEVTISLYQRQKGVAAAPAAQPPAAAANNARKSTTRAPLQPTQATFFIGSVKVKPKFADQKPEDSWLPLVGSSSSVAAGEIHVQLLFRKIGV